MQAQFNSCWILQIDLLQEETKFLISSSSELLYTELVYGMSKCFEIWLKRFLKFGWLSGA